ncbi:transposase [Pseudomonas guariconensis]|uniref:REP-associated tyrosine transposase n=1 Tax=Pseudomonas TaxID=286 RepID=UPI00209733F1|nr:MULTISPECIES: transposase [Pseudomonas]MCO7641952.1 transposase [Pseudomonas sp. S 311-6]MCO7516782.1 transposase [Pseudomonas putida]MCO7566965.1 transposase [Pseudomonas mosselii]MCO7607188.1 transposase [Pseudomonas guariconensis]MCO7618365.1 transposase [Pseudomonas guariconensis]
MDRPHSNQLRLGRFSEPGRLYLLTSTTLYRAPVLGNLQVARLLITQPRKAHEEGEARSLAWVVMPDHFHWLVELGAVDLKTLMRRVKSRSTQAINALQGRSGRFWQQGFHDRALRREEDVQAVARYIVMNPKRAGLVERIGDYPHWDAVWL